ncbi:MAG TPA: response regulator transcription factor [Chryseolinea sp.]|nr:response regulator transcription factor [Chryseolinea sp.]
MSIDKIRIAVADDHGMMRQGLISLLRTDESLEVIGDVDSGEGAINMARELSPDVIIMDILMKGITGIEATRWIKEHDPRIKIILISSEVNKDFITAGIKFGIDGYLPKDSDKDTLLMAIRSAMKGEKYFSKEITALIFEDFYLKEKGGKGVPTKKTNELSRREEQVLVLIAYGKNLREIADELFISVKTVESHKMHIQDKLALTNTAQLVKFAIEQGMIELKKPKGKSV